MLRLLSVTFAALAASAACGPFLAAWLRGGGTLGGYWKRLRGAYVLLGTHLILSLVAVGLTGYTLRMYPRYTGFVLGVCFGVFWVRFCVQAYLHRMIPRQSARLLVLCMLFHLLFCLCMVLLCSAWGALLLLLPVVIAPVIAGIVGLADCVLMRAADNRRVQSAMKKRARLSAVNAVIVAGGSDTALCMHMVSYILGSAVHCVAVGPQDTTLPQLARVVCSKLDGRSRFLIAQTPDQDARETARLCALLQPRVAVLPCSADAPCTANAAVIRTVLESIPRNGAVIAPAGAALDGLQHGTLVRAYGADRQGDLYADNPCFSAEGTRFVLHARSSGESVVCDMPFLGRRALHAAVAACTTARLFGMPLHRIAEALLQTPPMQGVLHVRHTPDGVLRLENGAVYDAEGVLDSLWALGQFYRARRIAVLGETAGLTDDVEQNKRIGRCAAQAADLVLLVGTRQADAMYAGLLEAGFAEQFVYFADDACQAALKLENIVAPGDVVLQNLDLSMQ